MTPDDHRASVDRWRAARDARLRSPDGWLTLVGLHWLEEGEHRLGSSTDSEIQLRGDGVPARVGALHVADGTVRLVPDAAELRAGERPATEQELQSDANGDPTVLAIGDLRLHLIRRGDRLALRIRDRSAPALAAFVGVESYPIDPAWLVAATFRPAPAGTRVTVPDITGKVAEDPTPGWVSFEKDGASWRITALPGDDDGSLFLVFGDATNGRETYGGGRFLYTDPPAPDGRVSLDFNLAYNPPCVFSPFATCPLPPAENRMPLRITAGELAYRA